MTRDEYLIKLVPPEGPSIYRLRFRRRHIFIAMCSIVAAVGLAIGAHVLQLREAQSNVARLQALTRDQQRKLDDVAGQAAAIASRLRQIETHDAEIRRSIGIKAPAARTHPGGDAHDHATSLPAVARALRTLAAVSTAELVEQKRLRRSALHVLNVRHMRMALRTELLAAIPSINPAGDVAIRSTFGYRSSPFPEFHRGLDLAAEYGDTVRAAAAGTVVEAGWDGGFGIKVDIDHGNGYHTWYAHLSRANVTPGERVRKGEPIARVGSTGESTGAHLHYQIMHDGQAIDPEPFLSGVPKAVVATLPGLDG